MKSRATSKTILLAAGGTGGHIFPAIALAEVLLARGFDVELVTDHRFHHYSQTGSEGALFGLPIHTIRASTLRGNPLKKLMSLIGIGVGLAQARRIIRKIKPIAVVGFGGYPSFPTMLAAILSGKRTIIHEQNSVLGRVNRVIAARATRIGTTYRETQKMPPRAKDRLQLTGNPVRAAICALAQIKYPELASDGLMRILVIGGSQGASVFSEVLPKAFALLPPDLRARIRLDQQCRAGEIGTVRAAYQALGMQVDLAPFFADVPARLGAAHLVISRAGASSVAELMVAGRPALLVPLPSATDNHQYFNAQAIEDSGAGWVVTQEAFTPAALAAKLETLLRAPHRLNECAAAMHRLGSPQAAEMLADLVLDRAQLKPKRAARAASLEHAA